MFHPVSGKTHRVLVVVTMTTALMHCSLLNRDRKIEGEKQGAGFSGRLIGDDLGDRAGGINEELLAEVHDTTTTVAPAALRADPDVYVRQLLREYRSEGSVMAEEIGRVEKYRMLLGGASEDFKTPPAKNFDATSLLASQKVAEEICRALVDPTEAEHPGWDTILPAGPSKVTENLTFLAQRFLGVRESRISDDILTALRTILDASAGSGKYANSDYVPVCVALAMDADALLF